MSEEWRAAIDSFIDMFAYLDFSKGPLFYVVGIIIAGDCCLEGFRFYKMFLMAFGFIFGYRVGLIVFTALGWSGEQLLMGEVFLGLIGGALSYKVYLAGIFIVVFQFGQENLPVYLEPYFMDKLSNFGPYISMLIISVISFAAALIVAKMAVGMSRMVVVCITAVVGGFAAVNNLLGLIPLFPYKLLLPASSSIIWLGVKIFLSMAGVGIQGTKD
ncbi:hypothetical protein QYZ88_013885 [Lachnospiraceae bacterium C1.1]|nr:hypothetical protein [Lachnospiraceae bacterium C1.1]